MLDFFKIATRTKKKDYTEVYPKFLIKKSEDLMIRGGDFYAVWIEEIGMWSTDEQDVFRLIDAALDEYVNGKYDVDTHTVRILYMWDAESGMVDAWHKYCQKQLRDCFETLDENLVFATKDGRTKRKDYASKTLSYALQPGDISAYDKLISTLYSKEERHKIEWAIGAIVSGDSKRIQKFMVLYGSAGTGKSTILNIVQMLFDGYYTTFDAKALGSTNGVFALEPFKNNPLVAIQHDGDLSRIEDNTRLNSLVSHEQMTVNEKHKSLYSAQFKCFLFMGTNKPVRITDAKSGLIRRLIDVSPSGNKLTQREYESVMGQIKFELGAIASHCLEVYRKNPGYYNTYIPKNMLGASNDFYNFVEDSYFIFQKEDSTTLKSAWEMYKEYCAEAKVPYPYSQRVFKEELKNYFDEFKDRFVTENNLRVRNYYIGFKVDKFESKVEDDVTETENRDWIELKEQSSIFDQACSDLVAQYATDEGRPLKKWKNVKTLLKDLDTSQLHYVMPQLYHIVVDFDIPDENGEKSLELNLQEANKWPKTYAEVSKSGKGLHLHYFYTGDPEKLNRVYAPHIEIKVFTGNSSLRRKLTKCNDLPIASIGSGLPLKGEKKVVNQETIKSERGLRKLIQKNLKKEIHPGTKPSVDFIFKILDDAYTSGLKYDVTDLKSAILTFAANSSHHAKYCIDLVGQMKFKSEEPSEPETGTGDFIFYDIEVFPNLLLICWKSMGEKNPVVTMINPSPMEIEELIRHNLIGFNCRRYDNHIIYAALMGYSPERCYKLSQRIISGDKNAFFGEAYNISYTDIYDFASAGNKKSLKKLEIDMGIHHQELGLPWDQPVDEALWPKVADYCKNDVVATEASFNYLKADWTARQILADLTNKTVNDTTNSLTTALIFGKNRNPQDEFCYRDMSELVDKIDVDVLKFLSKACPDMIGDPVRSFISPATDDRITSVLPYFPEYTYEKGVSMYRGEEVGEGGYVYAEPGIHTNVALLDVASMHPHSIIAECLFGPKYTRIFRELVEARVAIKHENWDEARGTLDGKMTPYIQRVIDGEMTSKELANALKTAINSVYGLTAAGFINPFRDIRNVDNIVAKRGALFMVDLKYEVMKRGFTVAHIKTDSIKIPNATPEIIQFVMDFGKRYGYTFEHEATYEKMCLVNDAVYIAKYAAKEWCEEHYGYLPDDIKKKAGKWTATGTQFKVPYVFKTLFSRESVEFTDFCETKSVTSSLYLDLNEKLPQLTPEEEKELDDLTKVLNSKDSDNFVETDPLFEKAHKKYGYSYEKMISRHDELCEFVRTAHNYRFIGRVGQFCPIKDGFGGGILVREKDGKYYAVGGTKGYRWLESEMVQALYPDKWEEAIDRSYYDNLVNDAVEKIGKYGDVEWFCE